MLTKRLNFAAILSTLSLLSYWPIKVAAQIQCREGQVVQGTTCIPNVSRAPWSNINTISEAVGSVLNILLLIVGLVAVIFIVIGGYQYITAGGSEENVDKAKKRIFNALIGLVIVLVALALVRIVTNLVSGDV